MIARAARGIGRLASAVAPVLAALAIWAPIRRNYFLEDDFIHLFDLVTLPVREFVTHLWGGHVCIVPNTVLLAAFRAFGPDSVRLFSIVLAVHALNAFLLHRVVLRFTRDHWLATFGALLWATCPVLEGALGWYSVQGQVMLTTLLLLVVADLGRVLDGGSVVGAPRAALWAGLLVTGAGSFGSGIATAVTFPAVLCVAVPAGRRTRGALVVLGLGAVAVIAGYATLKAHTPPAHADELLGTRATLTALPDAALLTTHLLGFGSTALLGGVTGRAPSYPDPADALPVGAVAIVVVGGWLAGRAGARRALAALALLVVAVYGATAGGRAAVLDLLDQSVAVAATWPRYHYLATALLTALLCTGVAAWRMRSRAAGRLMLAVAGITVATRLGYAVAQPLVVDHHDFERASTEKALRRIRDDVRAVPPGHEALLEAQPFPPVLLLIRMAHAFFPGTAGLFPIFFPENELDGRPVRFIVPNEDFARAESRGGRLVALVTRAPAR